jgi:hypothetical protein
MLLIYNYQSMAKLERTRILLGKDESVWKLQIGR